MRIRGLFWLCGITSLANLCTIANVFAQTNPCPKMPSQSIISSQNLSLFDTPNSDRQIVYTTQANETLTLLDTNALHVNDTCWYRIQNPAGFTYPKFWLATQLDPEASQSPESAPLLPNLPWDFPNLPINAFLTPTLLLFFSLGSLISIVALFYCFSLAAKLQKVTVQNQKLFKMLQANIETTQKANKRLEILSKKMVNLEKKVLSKAKTPPIQPVAIDLAITNLLRQKGPLPFPYLAALTPQAQPILEQRLQGLQQESLIYLQLINETPIYSLFPLSQTDQQLITLILAFNQQDLSYFQEQRSQPLNLRENTSPKQLEKVTDLAKAHYLLFTIEAEYWLIPNILSPEIAQIMRHVIDFPDLFTIISGSGSLYLIKPAKLYPLENEYNRDDWGIAEIGEFQWLNLIN